MEIISVPAGFSSVFGPLVYLYGGAGGQQLFEVEIAGGTPPEVLAVKRFAAAPQVAVDVAAPLGRKLSPEPIAIAGCGFYEDTGRTVECRVVHEGVAAPPRIFTAALETLSDGQLLSLMPPHRDIACTERDEVSFATEGGTWHARFEVGDIAGGRKLEFATDHYAAREGIITFVADMREVCLRIGQAGGNAAAGQAVNVRIFRDSVQMAHIVYVLRDECGDLLRLCWLNRLGGLDSFTFNSVRERVVATKERILTREGYVTVASAVERIFEINSGYRPRAVMEALAGITLSSRVWMCHNEVFVPVDVLSDGAVTFSREPGCMRLEVRTNRRISS